MTMNTATGITAISIGQTRPAGEGEGQILTIMPNLQTSDLEKQPRRQSKALDECI